MHMRTLEFITTCLTDISIEVSHTYHLSTLYLNYLSCRQHIYIHIYLYIHPWLPTLGPSMSSLAVGAGTPTQTISEPAGVSRYHWFLTQLKTYPLDLHFLLVSTLSVAPQSNLSS
jgi:hypothetical protein